MIPHIDPQLAIWGWEIPLYLFLGGLVAGILFFSTYYFIRNKKDDYPAAVKKAPLLVVPLLVLGLFALFLDLEHKWYVWRFYTAIRFESPMSWGSWTLFFIIPLSMLWSLTWIHELYPGFSRPLPVLNGFAARLKFYRKHLAWSLLVFSVILGMYTGILLSAFNARPFWNSAILGPLFLTSGLSTGAASILLLSKSEAEKQLFRKIDITLIAVELFLIIHLFMGFLAGTQVHVDAALMFLGGPLTADFWIFVVALGLVVPLIIEIFESRGYKVSVKIPALLVLAGGLLLRFIIVDAGQSSRWLYKFFE